MRKCVRCLLHIKRDHIRFLTYRHLLARKSQTCALAFDNFFKSVHQYHGYVMSSYITQLLLLISIGLQSTVFGYNKSYSNIDKVIADIDQRSGSVEKLVIDYDHCLPQNSDDVLEDILFQIHLILKRLSSSNRQIAIPEHIINELNNQIEGVVHILPHDRRDQFSAEIINLLSEYPINQSDSILIKSLNDISTRHHILSEIIYTKFLGGVILPIQAFEYIKEEIHDKMREKSIYINYKTIDLLSDIDYFIKDIIAKPTDEKISFLVRHLNSSHISHVHLTKNAGGIKFFISDSLGHAEREDGVTPPPRFTEALIKQISSTMQGQYFELYVVSEQRQRDHINCGTVALGDVIQTFKNDNVFLFINQNSVIEKMVVNIQDINIPIIWVHSLPFEFKKATQSLSSIDKYEQQLSVNCYQRIQIEKIRQIYTWYAKKKDTDDYRDCLRQNGYTIHKRNALISMIVHKILSEASL